MRARTIACINRAVKKRRHLSCCLDSNLNRACIPNVEQLLEKQKPSVCRLCARVDDNMPPKTIFFSHLEHRHRNVDRPRLRFKDILK